MLQAAEVTAAYKKLSLSEQAKMIKQVEKEMLDCDKAIDFILEQL